MNTENSEAFQGQQVETGSSDIVASAAHTEIALYQAEQHRLIRMQQQKDTFRNTVAKGASDAEIEQFCAVAAKYDLDPFLGEIWFFKPEGNSGPGVIRSGRDGFLKAAKRPGTGFRGMVSHPVYEKDEFRMNSVSGEVHHVFGHTNRGRLMGAYAVAYREGMPPVSYYAPLEEHQRETKAWGKNQALMILKVPEGIVLKKAFGVSGLEFGDWDEDLPSRTEPQAVIDDRDPFASIGFPDPKLPNAKTLEPEPESFLQLRREPTGAEHVEAISYLRACGFDPSQFEELKVACSAYRVPGIDYRFVVLEGQRLEIRDPYRIIELVGSPEASERGDGPNGDDSKSSEVQRAIAVEGSE